MKAWYALLDIGFSVATVWLFLNGQVTNALICWAISELYSLQRHRLD